MEKLLENLPDLLDEKAGRGAKETRSVRSQPSSAVD